MKRNDGPMSQERFLDLFADFQEEPVRGEASVWHSTRRRRLSRS